MDLPAEKLFHPVAGVVMEAGARQVRNAMAAQALFELTQATVASPADPWQEKASEVLYGSDDRVPQRVQYFVDKRAVPRKGPDTAPVI